MKTKKPPAVALCALVLAVALCAAGGCAKGEKMSTPEENSKESENIDMNIVTDYMLSLYTPPQTGEEIAVLDTDYGKIYIRIFWDWAPLAAQNFSTHIKNGYYNGVQFHRVIDNFMIQGGDPTGLGNGGDSIWGEDFKDEFNVNAHNLRGALSMANAGQNTNGSQFFIVQCRSVHSSWIEYMRSDPVKYPPEYVDAYEKYGGTPSLDYKHTVFGFVFKGMEVVDAIAAVDTDSKDRPLEKVLINSAEIIEYTADAE